MKEAVKSREENDLGKKGGSKGLKRNPAPGFWPIHRKEFVWVVKPSCGPHSLENCLPLAVVLRDVLALAKTRKEAKIMVSQGKVYVDGKVRQEDDFPIGLMDVFSLPEAGRSFRIMPSYKGLILHRIKKEESSFKLCRIENKNSVGGEHLQLNLHDGSNIIVQIPEAGDSQPNTYSTFDTLKISLPEREMLEQVKMKEKASALITGGKNIGKHGKIVKIEEMEGKKRRDALVTIEDESGNRFQTILNLVFSIGESKPIISLPEDGPLV